MKRNLLMIMVFVMVAVLTAGAEDGKGIITALEGDAQKKIGEEADWL